MFSGRDAIDNVSDALHADPLKSGTFNHDRRGLHQREAVRVIDDPFAALLCGGPLRLVLRFRLLEWLAVERMLGDMKPVTVARQVRFPGCRRTRQVP